MASLIVVTTQLSNGSIFFIHYNEEKGEFYIWFKMWSLIEETALNVE